KVGHRRESCTEGKEEGCHDNGQVPKEDARRSMKTEVEVPRATTGSAEPEVVNEATSPAMPTALIRRNSYVHRGHG
ncbi:hypothetical protein CRG98_049178, partial [Punica granatum]